MLLERLHRYVFDNIYIHGEDYQYKRSHYFILIAHKISIKIYPDYRRYLRAYDEQKYIRYTKQW